MAIELCSSLVLGYAFYVDVGHALSLCFHCLVNEGCGESRLYRSAAKLGVFVAFWEMKASVDFTPGKSSSVCFASNGNPSCSLEKWLRVFVRSTTMVN